MHSAVGIPEDDRAFATRRSRYCARNPVALERLTYDRTAKAVTYRSDKVHGPTAGTEPVNPNEVLVRAGRSARRPPDQHIPPTHDLPGLAAALPATARRTVT